MRRSSGPARDIPLLPLPEYSVSFDFSFPDDYSDPFNTSIQLTKTEFDILVTLMESPEQVFTRDQIIDRVLGYTYEGFERTIDAHVRNLRKKIEPDANDPVYIKTVFGVGYKIEEVVLSEYFQKISATKIRKVMRKEGKLK